DGDDLRRSTRSLRAAQGRGREPAQHHESEDQSQRIIPSHRHSSLRITALKPHSSSGARGGSVYTGPSTSDVDTRTEKPPNTCPMEGNMWRSLKSACLSLGLIMAGTVAGFQLRAHAGAGIAQASAPVAPADTPAMRANYEQWRKDFKTWNRWGADD